MKVSKYHASEETAVLTALIVHDRVLSTVARELRKIQDPFQNKWSNIIAGWCFDYHRKHGRAPGKLIQDLFVRYAQKEEDAGAVELVERFLGSLSNSYKKMAKEVNERWVLDRAAELFEKVRLGKMAEKVQLCLERHDLENARKFYQQANIPSFSEEGFLNPFSKDSIISTVDDMEFHQPVIKFRGDLGKFLSPYFEREGFIAVAAAEKKGKSYWLMDFVWQALNQRRRVLYYVLGDMSSRQVYRRLYARMTGKPEPRKNKAEGLKIPTKLKAGPKEENTGYPTAIADYKTVKFENLDIHDVNQAVKMLQTRIAMEDNPLRLRCAGAGIVSASDIESDVKRLSSEGWPPDLVVCDYLDLLAPEPNMGRLDFRHQIDASWKVCRRISTDYHLLFIGATQVAAKSYKQWILRQDDFSEDKRKNAHVTGMLGLNQTPNEKERGIYRLNWMFLRDGVWTPMKVCWTAGNLALGNPAIKSLI